MAIDLNKFKKINATHTTIVTRSNQKKVLEIALNKNTSVMIRK